MGICTLASLVAYVTGQNAEGIVGDALARGGLQALYTNSGDITCDLSGLNNRVPRLPQARITTALDPTGCKRLSSATV